MSSVYVVTDVETDGLCPGVHSMLSLGSVAVVDELDSGGGLRVVSEFGANLLPLDDCMPLPSTMAFWRKFPDAYEASTTGAQPAGEVMSQYDRWLRSLARKVLFVGYPVTFDYSFVWYYLWRFVGEPPFEHGGLDMKTLSMAILKRPYKDCWKGNWPREWHPPQGTHAHTALADAQEQAFEFMAMWRIHRQAPTNPTVVIPPFDDGGIGADVDYVRTVTIPGASAGE